MRQQWRNRVFCVGRAWKPSRKQKNFDYVIFISSKVPHMKRALFIAVLVLTCLGTNAQNLDFAKIISFTNSDIMSASSLLVANGWHINGEENDTATKVTSRTFVKEKSWIRLGWYEIADSGIPYITVTFLVDGDAFYLSALQWLQLNKYRQIRTYTMKRNENISEYTTEYQKVHGLEMTLIDVKRLLLKGKIMGFQYEITAP